MVPLTDRHIISVGTGMHWGEFTLDLSYGYLFSRDKDVEIDVVLSEEYGISQEQEATFKNAQCHMIGMTIGYAF